MPTYTYRSGSQIKGVSASTAQRELERIRKQRGKLTAEIVVEEAKSKKSPLHAIFQWEDSIAAHEYRLWQARALQRSIIVVYSQPQEDGTTVKSEPVNWLLRVKEPEGRDGRYVPTSIVIRSPDLLQNALDELLDKLDMAARPVETLRRMLAAQDEKDKRIRIADRVKSHLHRASSTAEKIKVAK